jgi:hypothetical protein
MDQWRACEFAVPAGVLELVLRPDVQDSVTSLGLELSFFDSRIARAIRAKSVQLASPVRVHRLAGGAYEDSSQRELKK